MRGAVGRYRVIAYITGVWLLLLFAVAMPLKYFAGNPALVEIVAPIHGVLYMVYVVAVFDLSRRRRWTLGWTVIVMLGGAVPFLSFVAERRVTAQEHQHAHTETART